MTKIALGFKVCLSNGLFLNHQFGLKYNVMPKRVVEGYTSRIPAVLELLKRELLRNNGHLEEGIFRLAPDKMEMTEVKRQINSGTFESCSDVNILATLIKVYFREAPEALFNSISVEQMYLMASLPIDRIPAEFDKIPEPQKSLILWLLDVLAQVVLNEEKTKMSARNVAICVSPNLFSITDPNPSTVLVLSQKVAEFTLRILASRMQVKWNKSVAI